MQGEDKKSKRRMTSLSERVSCCFPSRASLYIYIYYSRAFSKTKKTIREPIHQNAVFSLSCPAAFVLFSHIRTIADDDDDDTRDKSQKETMPSEESFVGRGRPLDAPIIASKMRHTASGPGRAPSAFSNILGATFSNISNSITLAHTLACVFAPLFHGR